MRLQLSFIEPPQREVIERMPDGRILAASRFEWLHPLEVKPLPYPPSPGQWPGQIRGFGMVRHIGHMYYM